MLGLHELTGDAQYLDESKAAIAHVGGTGFDLSYETHMSAYTAAAAQRLYTMTGDTTYHGYAVLALANLFHAVRISGTAPTECVRRDRAITRTWA